MGYAVPNSGLVRGTGTPTGHPDRQGGKYPASAASRFWSPVSIRSKRKGHPGTPSRILEASGGTDSLRPLFPDHGEMHDGLHGLFHVLHADSFQPRLERVLAGENIGTG